MWSETTHVLHYFAELTDPDRRLFGGFPDVFSKRQFRVDRNSEVHGGRFRLDNLVTDPYQHDRFNLPSRQYHDFRFCQS